MHCWAIVVILFQLLLSLLVPVPVCLSPTLRLLPASFLLYYCSGIKRWLRRKAAKEIEARTGKKSGKSLAENPASDVRWEVNWFARAIEENEVIRMMKSIVRSHFSDLKSHSHQR